MVEVNHNLLQKKINSDLSSAKTRDKGITALREYLPRCPDETFTDNCVNWMTQCCKNDYGNSKAIKASSQTLRELLLLSGKFQELKKTVSNFISSKFFDQFFKYLSDSEDGWLCAKACFSLYKGSCGPHMGVIKENLDSHLNKNVKITPIIAQCYALLPSLGGGGHGGINYKTNWKNQYFKIINTMHSILNQLFSSIREMQEYETSEEIQKIDDASKEHLSILLYNYSIVLETMLKSKFIAAKPITPNVVINLVCRGLAVTPKTLGNQLTSDILALQNILPQVHTVLYSLLNALIVTCRTCLFPYAHLICKLVKQTLEWSESDFKYGSEKSFASVRIAAYSALSNWITAARAGSCAEAISSTVIFAFKKDIIPQKPTLMLQGTEKAKAAKAGEKTKINRVDESANAKLCFSALKTMQLYVKYLGIFLKREEHADLQNVITRELMEIQCSPSVTEISIPYSVNLCRLELYAVLSCLTLNPHPHYPPPTQYALRIFSQGMNDKDPQISNFCFSAINDITNIIHPAFKVSTFPINLDSMRITTNVEFPDQNERSVNLQWRETSTRKELQDDVMEVDVTPTKEPSPAKSKESPKKLANDTSSANESSLAKGKESPKKFSNDTSSANESSLAKGKESPRKVGPNSTPDKTLSPFEKKKSPEKVYAQEQDRDLMEFSVAEIHALQETLRRNSTEESLENNISPKCSPSPSKASLSGNKSLVEEKAASPASPRISPSKISPLNSAEKNQPSPKKASPAITTPENQKEGSDDSAPGSPIRRSTRRSQVVSELSKSEDDLGKNSPSPKKRKLERITEHSDTENASPQDKPQEDESPVNKKSGENASFSGSETSHHSEKTHGELKEAVVKLSKLTSPTLRELRDDKSDRSDKSDKSETNSEAGKRYFLRSKTPSNLHDEGSSTPKRGAAQPKPARKKERSSSTESGNVTFRSKKKTEKPKEEEDIMELFDESLNPED